MNGTKTIKYPIVADLVFCDFHQRFTENPREACGLLLELLMRRECCAARIGYLTSLTDQSRLSGLTPGGELSEYRFLREFVWIASGQLDGVATNSPHCLLDLPHLSCHATALKVASACLSDGMPTIQDRIDAHQQLIQDWLWGELKSGSLLQWDGGRFAGRYVASWSKSIPYTELTSADDPAEAIRLTCDKWAVSPALVATVHAVSIWA